MGKFSKPATPAQAPRLERKIARQIGAIASLSVVLGLMFNASNPLGIRWSKTPETKNSALANTALGSATSSRPVSSPAHANRPTPVAAPLIPPVPVPAASSAGAIGQAAPASIPTIQQPTALATLRLVASGPAAPVTSVNNQLAVSSPAQSSTSTASNLLPPPPIPLSITWAEAKPIVTEGKAVLIDARHRPNFEAGHIPGAISLPITSPIEELEAFQKKYPPETRLIVYCGSASCALSKRLAEQLVYQYRFQNVHYMIGGYQEWQRSELAAPKPGT